MINIHIHIFLLNKDIWVFGIEIILNDNPRYIEYVQSDFFVMCIFYVFHNTEKQIGIE